MIHLKCHIKSTNKHQLSFTDDVKLSYWKLNQNIEQPHCITADLEWYKWSWSFQYKLTFKRPLCLGEHVEVKLLSFFFPLCDSFDHVMWSRQCFHLSWTYDLQSVHLCLYAGTNLISLILIRSLTLVSPPSYPKMTHVIQSGKLFKSYWLKRLLR